MLAVAPALSTTDGVAGGQGRRSWTNAAACMNRVHPGAAEPRALPRSRARPRVRIASSRAGAAVEGARGHGMAVGASLGGAAPVAV